MLKLVERHPCEGRERHAADAWMRSHGWERGGC
jgi:hypothetical protein